ncbi:MAG: DUF971 domain-containing protein, partial [Porticoccaceae bacterium]|nr:DUF971 domain-containing protein [Porticoccaceae bacterium]
MSANNLIPTPDNWYWPPSQNIASVEINDNAILVLWDNDKRSTLHPLWLRDNCCCALCLHQVTRENLLDLRDIPADIQALSLEIDAEGALCITWPE